MRNGCKPPRLKARTRDAYMTLCVWDTLLIIHQLNYSVYTEMPWLAGLRFVGIPTVPTTTNNDYNKQAGNYLIAQIVRLHEVLLYMLVCSQRSYTQELLKSKLLWLIGASPVFHLSFVMPNVAVIAKISLTSLRKLFIFSIKKWICSIPKKVSQKKPTLEKTNTSLVNTCSHEKHK